MIDALTLAVVRHKLLAVTEEVVETMVRTCFSPLLNQSRDLSAVVLDGDAQVVAQAERTPIHMGAMPFAVRAMAEDFALMYEWFDRVGYSADIAGLRRDYPEVGWMSFEDWAKVQDWKQLLS